ncbi:MAG: Gfo/Idh/MocA family protein [Armatimonadota bacterium]
MALRVGIAGLRRGAGVANVFLHHKECEVVAGCDLNADLAKQWTSDHNVPHWFDDYSKFCEADLDAILVATPAPVHVPCVVEAMENGKHVLSEVPACYDLQQARELVDVVEKTGLKYMFAENMCYYAWVQTYRDMIHRGDLGEIVYAEGEYIHDLGGLMFDKDGNKTWRTKLPPIMYPTHDLGPILQIMQDRVVTAVGMHTGCRKRPEIGNIDMEVGIFKTAKGNVIKQLCGFSVAKEPAHHWFCIYGTEGQIESPRTPTGKHLMYTEHIPNLQGSIELPLSATHTGAPPEALGGHGTSEYYMVNDFVRCILDDTKPAIDVYEGLDQTLPGICAHMSAEQGSIPVEVPDLRPK